MRGRILIVVNDFWRGGAEKNAKLLYETLKSEGFDINCVHIGKYANVEHSLYSRNRVYRIIKLIRYLNKNSPNVIISFSTEYGILLTLLKTFFGYKICLRLLNNPHFTLLGPKRYLFYRTIKNADQVVCQSYKMCSELKKSLRLTETKMKVITNPVEISDTPRTAFRREGILMVGKLEKQKRYDKAIELMSLLLKINSNIVLTIIGEGSQREELEKLVKSKRLSKNIRFIGRIERANEEMRKFKVLWLTSDYEGYPNVLLEALATDTPVISFDCDYGPAEIVENGISGFVVPKSDLRQFIEKTLEVLDWSKNRRSLINGSVKNKTHSDYIDKFKQLICEFS